jgi:hypothetical protein
MPVDLHLESGWSRGPGKQQGEIARQVEYQKYKLTKGPSGNRSPDGTWISNRTRGSLASCTVQDIGLMARCGRCLLDAMQLREGSDTTRTIFLQEDNLVVA